MILTLIVTGVTILVLPRLITELFSFSRINTIEKAPMVPVGIVFGAGLNRDGSPTAILRHRIATAVDLYYAGKIKKILVSGDNRFIDYNEPGAMFDFARLLGIPAEDIILDYAGRRTYDTCYRAKHIFKLNEAILITQRFHLPRALFTCNLLGLKSTGVKSDRVSYRLYSWLIWNFREIPATAVALWQVLISKPLPVMGEPEPIFPEDNKINP